MPTLSKGQLLDMILYNLKRLDSTQDLWTIYIAAKSIRERRDQDRELSTETLTAAATDAE